MLHDLNVDVHGAPAPGIETPAANVEGVEDLEPVIRAEQSQASAVIEIGKRHQLFHDSGGDAYARVPVGAHFETYGIASASYKDILARDYYRLTQRGINRNALGDAVSTLSAIAKYEGLSQPVCLRVGEVDRGLVIDDGGQDWGCIEVTASGWRARSSHVVNFKRSGKPLALPTPSNGDFSRIWRYVNVAEEDRSLIAAWLLSALRPRGPYPILLLIGEQGTAKSATTRALKSLTDPSDVPLRPPLKDEKDLLVACVSSWVVALDNLSGIDARMSDALCRISTGGGFSARRLYTDADETLIQVQRPCILNGIDDVASRPDLAQRCIHLEMPVLKTRVTEEELSAGFKKDSPFIFAAILDGLALALKDHDAIEVGTLPRMADFAKWAAAGVPALGFSAADFMAAYRKNQANAIEAGLDTSAVASAVRKLVDHSGSWTGSTSELLRVLVGESTEHERSQSGWPRSPKGLITTLRRLAPSLRHVGVEYSQSRDAEGRYLTLSCKAGGHASQASLGATTDDGMTHLTDVQEPCTAYGPFEARSKDDPTKNGPPHRDAVARVRYVL